MSHLGYYVLEQGEGLAVVGRDTIFGNGVAMFLCLVALVLTPIIHWVFCSKGLHIVVTISLRQDAGSSDSLVAGVAMDDTGMGQISVEKDGIRICSLIGIGIEAIAVDDKRFGPHGELVEGAVHSEEAGVEDVDGVYLLGSDNAHSPGHSIALYLFAQGIAPFLGEFLRVIEGWIVIVTRQNDGSSIDAAR